MELLTFQIDDAMQRFGQPDFVDMSAAVRLECRLHLARFTSHAPSDTLEQMHLLTLGLVAGMLIEPLLEH